MLSCARVRKDVPARVSLGAGEKRREVEAGAGCSVFSMACREERDCSQKILFEHCASEDICRASKDCSFPNKLRNSS